MANAEYITWLFLRAKIERHHPKHRNSALRLAMTFDLGVNQ